MGHSSLKGEIKDAIFNGAVDFMGPVKLIEGSLLMIA
jgi:hypothetical protein